MFSQAFAPLFFLREFRQLEAARLCKRGEGPPCGCDVGGGGRRRLGESPRVRAGSAAAVFSHPVPGGMARRQVSHSADPEPGRIRLLRGRILQRATGGPHRWHEASSPTSLASRPLWGGVRPVPRAGGIRQSSAFAQRA